MKSKEIPTVEQLLIPTLHALEALGGTGAVGNINNEVCKILKISQKTRKIKSNEKNLRSIVEKNLGIARYHLTNTGYLDKLPSKEWKLVKPASEAQDPSTILEKSRQKRIERIQENDPNPKIDIPVNSISNIHPDFLPKRKPSILMEIIAAIILYGPPFLIVYFLTTWISSCIRDSF